MKIGIREKISLIVTACLITVILCFILLFLPKKKELKRIKDELKSTKMEYELLSNYISSVAFKSSKKQEISRKQKELLEKLPEKEDIATTLSQITKIGQGKNLRILCVKPIKLQLFKNYRSDWEAQLEEIPVEIVLEGRFFDVGKYLFDLIKIPFFGGYKKIEMESIEEIYPRVKANIDCILFFSTNIKQGQGQL